MSLSRAQEVLREAVEELLALRSERRELVCAKCLTIYLRESNTDITDYCPKCGGYLRARSLVVEAALREQVAALTDRIAQLEDSLTVVLDLGLEDTSCAETAVE